MTELQYASLVISLSTLGQVDIGDMEHEQLATLRELLDQAARNVRQALTTKDQNRQWQIESQDEERRGWLKMSDGEEHP